MQREFKMYLNLFWFTFCSSAYSKEQEKQIACNFWTYTSIFEVEQANIKRAETIIAFLVQLDKS